MKNYVSAILILALASVVGAWATGEFASFIGNPVTFWEAWRLTVAGWLLIFIVRITISVSNGQEKKSSSDK